VLSEDSTLLLSEKEYEKSPNVVDQTNLGIFHEKREVRK
jgi:hypothetical protein